MCSNYVATRITGDVLRAWNATLAPDINLEVPQHAFPWMLAPVMVREQGRRIVKMMRFGMVPYWDKGIEKPGKPMYNARSETAAEKREFAQSYRERRLLVPLDRFYEWVVRDGMKNKMRIRLEPRDGKHLMAAGLWHRWTSPAMETFEAFTILTGTPPRTILEAGHDRCPLFLMESAWDAWMEEGEKDPQELRKILKQIEPVDWKITDDPTTPTTRSPAAKAGIVRPKRKATAKPKGKAPARQGSFLDDRE
jgi:putative SOS response-associated peptidase YedK